MRVANRERSPLVERKRQITSESIMSLRYITPVYMEWTPLIVLFSLLREKRYIKRREKTRCKHL